MHLPALVLGCRAPCHAASGHRVFVELDLTCLRVACVHVGACGPSQLSSSPPRKSSPPTMTKSSATPGRVATPQSRSSPMAYVSHVLRARPLHRAAAVADVEVCAPAPAARARARARGPMLVLLAPCSTIFGSTWHRASVCMPINQPTRPARWSGSTMPRAQFDGQPRACANVGVGNVGVCRCRLWCTGGGAKATATPTSSSPTTLRSARRIICSNTPRPRLARPRPLPPRPRVRHLP